MQLIEQFIQERVYLKGVSPKTVIWYHNSFQAFDGALESKQTIMQRSGELRTRGVSAISVNTYLRCINAYLRWLHIEHGQDQLKIPRLKEEQKILNTFSQQHIDRLLGWKPRRTSEQRVHALVCLLLDTGLRIAEALALTREDVDFDNLVIRVRVAKGGKHRIVPMSFELRKRIWKYTTRSKSPQQRFLFESRNHTMLTVRNVQRDFKLLCRKLRIEGVRTSPHTLRHTFAISYLRAGGNLFYLSKILGHSSVKTTERYLQSLQIEDLQAVHNRFSLLARG